MYNKKINKLAFIIIFDTIGPVWLSEIESNVQASLLYSSLDENVFRKHIVKVVVYYRAHGDLG